MSDPHVDSLARTTIEESFREEGIDVVHVDKFEVQSAHTHAVIIAQHDGNRVAIPINPIMLKQFIDDLCRVESGMSNEIKVVEIDKLIEAQVKFLRS